MRKRLILISFLALTGTAYSLASPHQRLVAHAKLSDIVHTVLPTSRHPSQETRTENATPSSEWAAGLVAAAKDQIGVTTQYDGAYQGLNYPMGDIDRRRGVCTDVVIRALRDAHDLDLQVAVHEDMAQHFDAYPARWGLTGPDRNIDHRRVPNLRRYFERIGAERPLATTPRATDFRPGDIVTWSFGPGQPHIGIVSTQVDRRSQTPLIIHNAGAGTRLDNILFSYPITGHYRLEDALHPT